MKDRPILFSGPMVRALLAGTKTQARRICKTFRLYSLTDDRISVIHSHDDCEYHLETNPSKPERGLSSWIRWAHLQQNEIRWLWQKCIRGLVSLSWTQNQKGVFLNFHVSRQPEGYEVGPSVSLHGLPWHPDDFNDAGPTLGRKSRKQQAGELGLGHSGGKLDGQGGSREGNEGRETSCRKAEQRRARGVEMGGANGFMQSTACGADAWNVTGRRFRYLPWVEGRQLWARETWSPAGVTEDNISYRADNPDPKATVWRPSIHMPRWASRITLEITGIRVERLQEISERDAEAEGIEPEPGLEASHWRQYGKTGGTRDPIWSYQTLWESINGPGSWEANPWVWVVSFKRVEGGAQ